MRVSRSAPGGQGSCVQAWARRSGIWSRSAAGTETSTEARAVRAVLPDCTAWSLAYRTVARDRRVARTCRDSRSAAYALVLAVLLLPAATLG
jgi:hypothetical protein